MLLLFVVGLARGKMVVEGKQTRTPNSTRLCQTRGNSTPLRTDPPYAHVLAPGVLLAFFRKKQRGRKVLCVVCLGLRA